MTASLVALDIHRIPVLRDNYVFLIVDPATHTAAVVDPAIAPPVLELVDQLQVKLTAILNTHHHSDHVGGNPEICAAYPDVVVYGGAVDRGRIPHQRVFLEEGDRVNLGSHAATVLFVPGHTKAHIAYYFPGSTNLDGGQTTNPQPGHLFCGDTLFAGGCGRLFEGTPAQMVESLGKLRSLPDETWVWCAHEYTLNNLRFALTVDPQNVALRDRVLRVQQQRTQQQATIPANLGEEKRTNPFLRWDDPTIQQMMEIQDPVRAFARLRGRKDQF